MRAAPSWDLESIYPGGPRSQDWSAAAGASEAQVEALVARADALPPLPDRVEEWSAVVRDLLEAARAFGQVRVFASCWASADATSSAAQRAQSRTDAIASRFERAWVPVEDGVARATDEGWAALVARPELEDARPRLEWLRRTAHLKLPRAEASLVAELGRDGIHGWARLYDQVSGQLTVDVGDGPLRAHTSGPRIGIAQASNFLGHSARPIRLAAQDATRAAWVSVREPCAAALTHIVGTRQVLNDRRGVDPLADSLARNRMERASVEAMMAAAQRAQPLLQRYLTAKARMLGLERLGWEDVGAPLGDERSWSWDDARTFVLEHFGTWHPELHAYADKAFERRWIEAEDRPGKRQGGWCAAVPLHRGDSRIFMTWGSNFRSTTTLAHELGHGFHNWALRDLPQGRRYVPSTLAETASVFAENIVRDAALAAAPDDRARLAMLDARLSAGVSFLMNIPFRFQLELDLYAQRRHGDLDPDTLSERTVALQKASYGDVLSSWDPLFWASKLHFYIGGFAFYNYPYAFGYLFSSLVYQRARAEGRAWHDRYVALLQRTGSDWAEPLAADFLGLDLRDPDAWYGGVQPLEPDLVAFEQIVDRVARP